MSNILDNLNSLKVKDLIYDTNCQDLNPIKQLFSQDQLDVIMALPIPFEDSLYGISIWGSAFNGTYLASSSYRWLTSLNNDETNWNWVWHILIPPKIYFFLWLALWNRLLTNDLRQKRELPFSNLL